MNIFLIRYSSLIHCNSESSGGIIVQSDFIFSINHKIWKQTKKKETNKTENDDDYVTYGCLEVGVECVEWRSFISRDSLPQTSFMAA